MRKGARVERRIPGKGNPWCYGHLGTQKRTSGSGHVLSLLFDLCSANLCLHFCVDFQAAKARRFSTLEKAAANAFCPLRLRLPPLCGWRSASSWSLPRSAVCGLCVLKCLWVAAIGRAGASAFNLLHCSGSSNTHRKPLSSFRFKGDPGISNEQSRNSQLITLQEDPRMIRQPFPVRRPRNMESGKT